MSRNEIEKKYEKKGIVPLASLGCIKHVSCCSKSIDCSGEHKFYPSGVIKFTGKCCD